MKKKRYEREKSLEVIKENETYRVWGYNLRKWNKMIDWKVNWKKNKKSFGRWKTQQINNTNCKEKVNYKSMKNEQQKWDWF